MNPHRHRSIDPRSTLVSRNYGRKSRLAPSSIFPPRYPGQETGEPELNFVSSGVKDRLPRRSRAESKPPPATKKDSAVEPRGPTAEALCYGHNNQPKTMLAMCFALIRTRCCGVHTAVPATSNRDVGIPIIRVEFLTCASLGPLTRILPIIHSPGNSTYAHRSRRRRISRLFPLPWVG